jgi:redox-sensitive bicupin YhaK (pirin superfamily)
MIEVLKSDDRVTSGHGTVSIRRTFADGNPRDPHAGGLGALYSIAETTIAPSAGFPMHPHRDMEIISYIADGAMAHRDTLGNGTVIATNDIQRMSAGTGIIHSEFNPSDTEPCRCLQIWIHPMSPGIAPSYEQKPVGDAEGLRLIGAPTASDDAVAIRQDVSLYSLKLAAGASVGHRLAQGRRAYVQVARGQMLINGVPLFAGDGATIEDEPSITFITPSNRSAEALLFDLA